MRSQAVAAIASAILALTVGLPRAHAQSIGDRVSLKTPTGSVVGTLVERAPEGYVINANGETLMVPYVAVEGLSKVEQPAEPPPEQSAEPSPEQPAEPSQEQPAESSPQQPAGPSPEQAEEQPDPNEWQSAPPPIEFPPQEPIPQPGPRASVAAQPQQAAMAGPSAGQAPVPPMAPPVPQRPRRMASMTFSPVHLAMPVLEGAMEARLHDKIGLMAIFGLGAIDGVLVAEYGAQFLGYPLGTFDHGLQVGLELVHIQASSGWAEAQGTSVGGFLGYKFISYGGFTFNGQFGIQVVDYSYTSDTVVGPLLNLNLGWSWGRAPGGYY